LAGAATEALLTNQRLLELVGGRSRGDWALVLEAMQHDRDGLSLLARLADQATKFTRAGWDSVTALAEVLMVRGWLRYREVRRILGASPASSRG